MIEHHNTPSERPVRRYAATTAKVIGLVIALASLTHISWNMFAPDLFGMPDLRMKQALGMVVFTGLVGLVVCHTAHRAAMVDQVRPTPRVHGRDRRSGYGRTRVKPPAQSLNHRADGIGIRA